MDVDARVSESVRDGPQPGGEAGGARRHGLGDRAAGALREFAQTGRKTTTTSTLEHEEDAGLVLPAAIDRQQEHQSLTREFSGFGI